MPVTYVDKSVQEMPVQVKGIYVHDPVTLVTLGPFVENQREQFFLMDPNLPDRSLHILLRRYKEWGIASVAVPESAWTELEEYVHMNDFPDLEVFVCRGE